MATAREEEIVARLEAIELVLGELVGIIRASPSSWPAVSGTRGPFKLETLKAAWAMPGNKDVSKSA